MEHQELNELAKALATAQSEYEEVKQTGYNPHLKNKYSTLDDLINAVRSALARNGLSLVQSIGHNTDGDTTMTTMLIHESGQYLSDTAIVNSVKANRGINEMQALGSTLTYMRRYAASAMLWVGGQPDDDGNTSVSSGKQKKAGSRPYSPKELKSQISLGITKKKSENFSYPEGEAEDHKSAVVSSLKSCFEEDQENAVVLVSKFLTNSVSKDWDDAAIATLYAWLNASGEKVDQTASKEALLVYKKMYGEQRDNLRSRWNELVAKTKEENIDDNKRPEVSGEMTNRQISEKIKEFEKLIENQDKEVEL